MTLTFGRIGDIIDGLAQSIDSQIALGASKSEGREERDKHVEKAMDLLETAYIVNGTGADTKAMTVSIAMRIIKSEARKAAWFALQAAMAARELPDGAGDGAKQMACEAAWSAMHAACTIADTLQEATSNED